MTIYEYINKNLSNLNWNILPQIFESEGVELTEDIEKYLRETPGNTNPAILKDFGLDIEGSGEDEEDEKIITIFDISKILSYVEDDGNYIVGFQDPEVELSNPIKKDSVIHISIYYDNELLKEGDFDCINYGHQYYYTYNPENEYHSNDIRFGIEFFDSDETISTMSIMPCDDDIFEEFDKIPLKTWRFVGETTNSSISTYN